MWSRKSKSHMMLSKNPKWQEAPDGLQALGPRRSLVWRRKGETRVVEQEGSIGFASHLQLWNEVILHTQSSGKRKWASREKNLKSLQATQAVWERSVQAERPEAKQLCINYLLQTEGNFLVNWAADVCPVLATNMLLRRILSLAPCNPCWNLLPWYYWQLNSSLVPPWHIVLINPLW